MKSNRQPHVPTLTFKSATLLSHSSQLSHLHKTNTQYNTSNIAGNYKMANDIPINDIPFDRDTFNLIDYDSCKEVVHGMVHDANHTVQSIESLTNDLWALQLTDQARIAINNDLRERWAQEANERDRHQGHLPVDDPRRQNPNDIGVPMGNNIDLYNGQQTRGVTKNTRPGNSPRDPTWPALPQGIRNKLRLAHADDGHRRHVELAIRTLLDLAGLPADHQAISQIPNISNLQDLLPVHITEYLTGKGLVITLRNDFRQVLRCETDTPPLSLLVFTAHEHNMEPTLTWSTGDQGTVVMLLIRDMGLLCPFIQNGQNIHLGYECYQWAPTVRHVSFANYFQYRLTPLVCPVYVGANRGIRTLEFQTAITVAVPAQAPAPAQRGNNRRNRRA